VIRTRRWPKLRPPLSDRREAAAARELASAAVGVPLASTGSADVRAPVADPRICADSKGDRRALVIDAGAPPRDAFPDQPRTGEELDVFIDYDPRLGSLVR
jgi:hypothetical protein